METMDLIIVGYRDWGHGEASGINVRDLHLTVELSLNPKVRRILYVSRPVSLAEHLLRKKPYGLAKAEVVESGKRYTLYRDTKYGKIYPLNTALPEIIGPVAGGRAWWDAAFNRKSVKDAIKRSIERLGIKDAVLLNFTPFAPSVAKTIPHRVYAFDMIDNFANHQRINSRREKSHCMEGYSQVSRQADVITSVSARCLGAIGAARGSVKTIGNGVERSWLKLSPAVPEDIAQLRGPVVGCGGYFFSKFDAGLLVSVARSMPKVSFVLIGRILDPSISKRIEGVPNIHFLGFRSFDRIPSYYHNFDAAFIMYIPELENDGDPLKLYEYLSLGTPVVATPSMGIGRHGKMVEVARTAAEFREKLNGFFSMDRKSLREACRAQLKEDDFWDSKADAMLGLYEKAYEKK